MKDPAIIPIADHALLVEFGTEISEATNQLVLALDRALAASPPDGLLEVVPAFVNLLIEFDPLVTDHEQLTRRVLDLVHTPDDHVPTTTTHRVPICYDATFGPDLATVAQHTGLTVEAVIAAHLAGDYRVFMYGFAPGYAYMAGVPSEIQVPRKPAAVRGVRHGSVIIAGPQCLITTIDMPTGWSVIGRSPTQVLRPHDGQPFLFDVGDRVSFERVGLADYERLLKQSAR